MPARIGINGFGRIGKQVLRAALERHADSLEVVAVNTRSGQPDDIARLFKYDSTYGRYPGEVKATGHGVKIDGAKITTLNETDPNNLPWGELGVEVVVESTGAFNDAGKASGHLESGANKVVISAPATGDVKTIVLGVNESEYDPDRHNIISCSSCTTNCIAPMAKTLHDRFGIERGLMTTIHSYTNDQRVLDKFHKDPRARPRRRAEHHPHHDRRRQVRRHSHARTRREDKRHGSARSHAQRLAHRLRSHAGDDPRPPKRSTTHTAKPRAAP